MKQIESRLRQAQQRAKPSSTAKYRCLVSDGRILYLNAWEILKYYNSLDENFMVMEPFIYKVECMDEIGRERDRKMCDIVEQVVEDIAAKAERGEIHRA